MTTLPPRLLALERAARTRRLAISIASWAPPLAAAAVVATRIGGAPAGIVAGAIGLVAIAAATWRSLRVIDPAWLARRLNALRPDLEDSAELIFPPRGIEPALAPLQRQRVTERLSTGTHVDIREPWPLKHIAQALGLAMAMIALALVWPEPKARPQDNAPAPQPDGPVVPAQTRLSSAQIVVEPPAYTGLATHTRSDLAIQAEEGARLRWRLGFDQAPRSVAIAFHDGSELALVRDADAWSGDRVVAASTLYRVRIEGAPPLADDALHRIDVIADAPPELRVIEPEKTLTLVVPGQRSWVLAFEARDDYGLAEARLNLTLAKGSGEQVEVSERTFVLAGEGGPRARRFARTFDLAALGISPGDDAIARLTLRDNREPSANLVRSPSLILRWPAQQAGETTGMDGLVERALPAYFRSQRQIIIDTEALIALRPRPPRDDFVDRSDKIGVDQKILRLRYGQFLGEEAETYGDAAHAADGHAGGDGDDHRDAETAAPATAFGDATDVLQQFGHAHDIAEAATLLDPQTRATLKAALAEMWQAELHLRIGEPAKALPYEYAALDYIKQVQQASRIYLSRVGLELPVVDEARRLTGERTGARSRASALVPATGTDTAVVELWRALESGAAVDWPGFDEWVRMNEAKLPDALTLLASVDALRREPESEAYRAQLRKALWPLLPVPASGADVRPAPNDAGRAYLDALGATPR